MIKEAGDGPFFKNTNSERANSERKTKCLLSEKNEIRSIFFSFKLKIAKSSLVRFPIPPSIRLSINHLNSLQQQQHQQWNLV